EAPAGSGEQPSFRLRAARDGPSAGQAVRRPPERAEARVDPASHEEAEDAARRGAQGRGHGALAPFAVVLSPWPSGPGCSRAFALAVGAWLQSCFRLGRRGLAAVVLSPWPSRPGCSRAFALAERIASPPASRTTAHSRRRW